jgi:hypothetical protein
MNTGSLSEMMEASRPWSRYTSFKNTLATELVVYGWDSGRKWSYLVNLSTTTKMQLEFLDLGSPSMKSSDIVSHASVGVGNGCSFPGYKAVAGLAWRQTWQVCINWW